MASYSAGQGENQETVGCVCGECCTPVCVCFSVETLSEAVSKVIQYLGGLLKGELRLEYAQLLLKMAIINIFSIHHAADSYTGWRATHSVGGADLDSLH